MSLVRGSKISFIWFWCRGDVAWAVMAVLSRIKVLQLQSRLGDAWFDAAGELRRFCPRQSSWMMGLFLLMSVGVAPLAVSGQQQSWLQQLLISAFCKQDHQGCGDSSVAACPRFERCPRGPAEMLGAIANLSRRRRSTIALIFFLKKYSTGLSRFSG
jgi:hypothetical protein